MKKFNYFWRLMSTGVAFSAFGIGGIVLTLYFSVLRLLYKNDKDFKKKARKTVHFSFKFFIGLMKYLGISTFSIENKEELAKLKGQVIMANHPSLIDVVVLISLVPNADCVVKAHLFKNPFMRGVIRNTGYISNENPEDLLVECKESLKEGNNLIIFPEGTRTTPGSEIKLLRGAANIVLRCNAKVTTVLLKVCPTTLTKTEKWYEIPDKRFDFYLKFAKNNFEFDSGNELSPSKISRDFTRRLEQHFIKELSNI